MASPIGNLADLSLRALHLLGLADAVACEDTRVTGQLLQRLGLHRPLLSVHEHNEAAAAAQVLQRLQRGERVAYLSDAGTPAISDPGARLVAAVRAAGAAVVPLPGASSVVTALSAAGDVQAQGFRFVGFLPPKTRAREEALARLDTADGLSNVLFESPHRIEALAIALAQRFGPRRVTLCRELTKQFEQIHTLPAADLPAWLQADADRRRGEFVLVLHAAAPAAASAEEPLADTPVPLTATRLLQALLPVLPLRQAVDVVGQVCEQPRKAVYARALKLREAMDEASPDEGDEGDAQVLPP